MQKTLTVRRETLSIYSVESNFPFWSTESGLIRERVTFDPTGRYLSNIQAQSIDAKNGNRYTLLSPFAVKNPGAVEAARALAIGQAVTVNV